MTLMCLTSIASASGYFESQEHLNYRQSLTKTDSNKLNKLKFDHFTGVIVACSAKTVLYIKDVLTYIVLFDAEVTNAEDGKHLIDESAVCVRAWYGWRDVSEEINYRNQVRKANVSEEMDRKRLLREANAPEVRKLIEGSIYETSPTR